MNSTPVIEVQQLTRRYGDLVAVRTLSLDVRRGEMFGLIGPTGAGKTTVLRTILRSPPWVRRFSVWRRCTSASAWIDPSIK